DAATTVGRATLDGSATAGVGLDAAGGGEVQLGLDGVAVRSGVDTFIGAKAEAQGEVSAGPASAAASCYAGAGAGLSAEAGAEASWDEVRFDLAYAAVWGFGGGCKTSLSFSPKDTLDGIKNGGEWVFDKSGELIDGTYEFVTDVGSTISDGWDATWDATIGRGLDFI